MATIERRGPQVDTPHPEYAARIAEWLKIRDALEGEDKVKAAGMAYLPQLSGQDEGEYRAYMARAMFYNASDRTVKGLTGIVMAKDPRIEFPEADQEFLEDLGVSGESLDQLITTCLEEDLEVGRLGLYVDADSEAPEEPYVAIFYAENIINWREELIDGIRVPTMVVLKECYEEQPKADDPFLVEKKDQWRVLKLVPSDQRQETDGEVGTEGYFYVVEIWRKKEVTEGSVTYVEFYMEKRIVPRIVGGRTLNYIPFKFINPTDTLACVGKSPILDLVNVNFSHYRTSADLEHGRHFTALPTAWVAGFNTKGTWKIGSGVAWVADDPNAKAGFLEFTGAGLGHLAEAMKEKERLMAVLGARLLEEQPKGVEAADTVKMRHAGERSVLGNIANAVSEALTTVLRWTVEWRGKTVAPAAISVELNTEYTIGTIDPQMLAQLILAVQSGQMSWSTLFFNLQRAGMIPDDRTEEDERKLIMELSGSTGTPGKIAPEDDEDGDSDEDKEDEPEVDDDEDDDESAEE